MQIPTARCDMLEVINECAAIIRDAYMWGSMNISDSGKSCFNSGRVNLFSNGSLQILTFDLKQQLRNPHCDN